MKISELRQIIKEEISKLNEGYVVNDKNSPLIGRDISYMRWKFADDLTRNMSMGNKELFHACYVSTAAISTAAKGKYYLICYGINKSKYIITIVDENNEVLFKKVLGSGVELDLEMAKILKKHYYPGYFGNKPWATKGHYF